MSTRPGLINFILAEICYFDAVTIKQINTKDLPHSHPRRYPCDYADK